MSNVMIIVIFFAVGFLLMIPFLMYNKKLKGKQKQFIDSSMGNKAVLHIYGYCITIDGKPLKKIEHIIGQDLQYVVSLPAGKHVISAKYRATSIGIGKNINYKMPKPIESILELDANSEYTIDVYFYSAEQREAYYQGDVGRAILSQPIEIDAVFGGEQAYIICYQDKYQGQLVMVDKP